MSTAPQSKDPEFSFKLKQVFLLILIVFLICISILNTAAFIPGLLGGVTLFFISRDQYLMLHTRLKLKSSLVGFFIVFIYLLLIGALVFLLIKLIQPQINQFFQHYEEYMQAGNEFIARLSERFGFKLLSDTTVENLAQRFAGIVPTFLNSTFLVVANLAIALIVMYYMLVRTETLETFLMKTIPFKKTNIQMVGNETKKMVKANAIGIPLICLIQGLTATLGYWIFGVPSPGLWGVFTGILAFFPVVGTTVVWLPACIYLYSYGQNWQGTGLLLYSLIVTGNMDYLARISILRRMANVHPLITLFGVLAGLQLFGFIGFIFGPLLLTYIIILGRVYMSEFV